MVSSTIFKDFVGVPHTECVREISLPLPLSSLLFSIIAPLFYLSSLHHSRGIAHLFGKIETRHTAIIFNREMASKRKVLSLVERIRVVVNTFHTFSHSFQNKILNKFLQSKAIFLFSFIYCLMIWEHFDIYSLINGIEVSSLDRLLIGM